MEEQGIQRLPDKDEMNLLDYCRVIWKRRNLISALCVGSILISLVYSLLTPKLYRTTATILSPMEMGIGGRNQIALALGGNIRGERSGSLLDSSNSSPAGLFSFMPSTPTQNTYVAILKSRTMREEVIAHFKQTWNPSVGSLVRGVEITLSEKGIISVTVEAQDPKLAAAVADFYLNHLSTTLARRAKNMERLQIKHYERQLDQVKRDLKGAQDAMIEFQEKNRYIALGPATRNAIAAGAMRAGSVMALEVERKLKRMYLTDQHAEMIALERRIYEAKKLLSHQLYGEPQSLPPESPGSPPRKEFFVAQAKMTPLQFKLIDVYRNLKFREALWSNVTMNIESLKYASENPATIHIDWLDHAIPPGAHSTPNLGYSLAVALVGSLVIGIFIALFLEYLERVKALDRLRQAEAGVAPGTPTP